MPSAGTAVTRDGRNVARALARAGACASGELRRVSNAGRRADLTGMQRADDRRIKSDSRDGDSAWKIDANLVGAARCRRGDGDRRWQRVDVAVRPLRICYARAPSSAPGRAEASGDSLCARSAKTRDRVTSQCFDRAECWFGFLRSGTECGARTFPSRRLRASHRAVECASANARR